jgi:spore germination cell wall hydrolase CwlJ-like protein
MKVQLKVSSVLFIVGCFFFCGEVAIGNSSDLTQNEKVVAATILAEARGEGFDGMQAVACVIKQRTIERKKSPAKICLQKYQFSCWNDGMTADKLYANVTKKTPAKIVNFAANLAKLLVSGKDLDRSFVKCANHYCTLETNPQWAKNIKPVVVIKNHKFYRL